MTKLFYSRYQTAQEGRLNAKADSEGGWVDFTNFTEAQLRHHLELSSAPSPEYRDGYIAEAKNHGLKP